MNKTVYSSPVGELLLASDGVSLMGLWLSEQKYYPQAEGWLTRDELPVFDTARAWLDGYFAGAMPPVSGIALSPEGSAFRRRVWDLLLTIPYGETTTYGEIAAQIAAETGRPASARAVGGAVGHNPISIIIPCHRVIGGTGNLTGYAGGVSRKAWLLKHENGASL